MVATVAPLLDFDVGFPPLSLAVRDLCRPPWLPV